MSDQHIPTDLVAPIFNPHNWGDRLGIEAMFARLRRDYPLSIAEVPGFDPHWMVIKYNDVREVSRLSDIFHSGDVSKTLVPQLGEKMMREFSGGGPWIYRTLVHMDDPDHTEYRNALRNFFMAKGVAKLEEDIRATVRRHLDDKMGGRTECDFASDVAMGIPLEVICNLIGLPKEDHHVMLRLTHWFFTFADPDLRRPGFDPDDPEAHIKTWNMVYDEFKAFYDPIIKDRRANPRDDIASRIVNAKIHGGPMPEREMISYLVICSTAGHDSTAASMAGGMLSLASQPGLLDRLKSDPSLIPSFAEEAIRLTSSGVVFVRSAAQDYELSGRLIKKGDKLYVSYFSAGRDEEAFENPNELRLGCTARPINFSYGSHSCLGQHLARLELRVLYEELIPRLESIEMAGEAKWIESDFAGGPKYVPIRYKMNQGR